MHVRRCQKLPSTSRAPPGGKPKVEAPRPATVPAVAELAPELPARPIYPIDLSTLPPASAIGLRVGVR